MDPVAVLEFLMDLAREAELEVRGARGGGVGEGDGVSASGICRLRDSIWVVLAASDPVSEQIAVLARALELHAPEQLEDRYLPPAVRAHLDRGP